MDDVGRPALYEVSIESVGGGLRTYTLTDVADGSTIDRSCDIAEHPLLAGKVYTLEEIEAIFARA